MAELGNNNDNFLSISQFRTKHYMIGNSVVPHLNS